MYSNGWRAASERGVLASSQSMVETLSLVQRSMFKNCRTAIEMVEKKAEESSAWADISSEMKIQVTAVMVLRRILSHF